MRGNRRISNYLNTIVPSAGGAIGCKPPQHIRVGAWRRLRGGAKRDCVSPPNEFATRASGVVSAAPLRSPSVLGRQELRARGGRRMRNGGPDVLPGPSAADVCETPER
jgi:hypothetical protein